MTSVATTRKVLERDLFRFVDEHAFLREAASRYQTKKATEAVARATALVKRVEAVLPEKYWARNDSTKDKQDETVENKSAEHEPFDVITVQDAIERAESILPGQAAPEGEDDPRWQAIMRVEDFVEEEPDAIWLFILRWGVSDDEDLRDAVAVLLLEHLLACHFARFFPGVEQEVRKSPQFANTFLKCWKLGEAAKEQNSERFEALRLECKKTGPII